MSSGGSGRFTFCPKLHNISTDASIRTVPSPEYRVLFRLCPEYSFRLFFLLCLRLISRRTVPSSLCSLRNRYGVVCQSCLAVYSPCRRPALLTGKNWRLQSSSQTDERCTYHSLERQSWFRGAKNAQAQSTRDHTTAPGYTRMSHPHLPEGKPLFTSRCPEEGWAFFSSRSSMAATQPPCPKRP